MLKFIKEHLASDGIEIYPMISFLIFFIFFLAVLVWIVKVRKEFVEQMSNLPLEMDGQSELNTQTSGGHEKK